MSLVGPEPLTTNPLRQLATDWRAERRAARDVDWPPGDNGFDARRTFALTKDPLTVLLDAYERHGPFFTLRLLSTRQAFMLGPEANHHVLVSHAADFRWRDGGFSQLIPLLGDGMLTIDGDFHRRSRRIMLPAFHSEQIAATGAVMQDETDRAVGEWRDGTRVDLYGWARMLALRIAMRALFGFERSDASAARDFEVALGFYGHDYTIQSLRGPRTPWARMHAARRRLDELIYAEIARRRASGRRGLDVLSLLLDAREDSSDGAALTDRQIRDQVMTLLFAGHDTTTATIAFLFYELGRNPHEDEDLADDGERLERALDETLRLYPPAWIGPRRTARRVDFAGHSIPADLPVAYSSYVSHRLPHVFEDPHAFKPERMTAKATFPRGAYVPFGGGSRICLGMRFGQAEIRVIARRILRDFRLRTEPGYELRIRQTPTLGPRAGLPMTVVARG